MRKIYKCLNNNNLVLIWIDFYENMVLSGGLFAKDKYYLDGRYLQWEHESS